MRFASMIAAIWAGRKALSRRMMIAFAPVVAVSRGIGLLKFDPERP
jgi:hypothetical protein